MQKIEQGMSEFAKELKKQGFWVGDYYEKFW
jgi:hypothetical protein